MGHSLDQAYPEQVPGFGLAQRAGDRDSAGVST